MERFLFQSSDILQCAFGRLCFTSWKLKKARLLSVIYTHILFLCHKIWDARNIQLFKRPRSFI